MRAVFKFPESKTQAKWKLKMTVRSQISVQSSKPSPSVPLKAFARRLKSSVQKIVPVTSSAQMLRPLAVSARTTLWIG